MKHLWGIGLSLALCACNSAPSSPTLPLKFQTQEVKEMTFTKSDPVTDDRWTARLQREQEDTWQIVEGPAGQPILDREANGNFVIHLLDTLKSLRSVGDAPNGPLGSFGLSPPRFALQWRTEKQAYQVLLGDVVTQPQRGIYLSLDGKNVVVATGSAIKLISLISSFRYLRKPAWTNLSSDDIDEIEIQARGKTILYAQREGSQWNDRLHRRVKQDMNRVLDLLTRSTPEDWIDQEEEAARVKTRSLAHPLLEAKLSDRMGKTTTLSLGHFEGKKVVGMNESRPQGVFVLKSEVLESLKAMVNF